MNNALRACVTSVPAAAARRCFQQRAHRRMAAAKQRRRQQAGWAAGQDISTKNRQWRARHHQRKEKYQTSTD